MNDYLRSNLALMVISLFLSLMLWGIVRAINSPAEPTSQRTIDVPIVYREAPEGLIRVSGPTQVKVILEGTELALRDLDTRDIFGIVDLQEATAGTRNYPIELSAPTSNVRVDLATRYAEVSLAVMMSESKPVEIVSRGRLDLAEGMHLTDLSAQPETVVLYGPREYLNRVALVRAVFDLANARDGRAVTVQLEMLDDQDRQVPFVRAEPSEVQVLPIVMPDVPEKQVLVVPDFSGQPQFGYEVVRYEVTPNQATLQGEFDRLADAFTIRTEPIDLSEINATRTFEARLRAPAGLTVKGANQVQVRVVIQRRPEATRPPTTDNGRTDDRDSTPP